MAVCWSFFTKSLKEEPCSCNQTGSGWLVGNRCHRWSRRPWSEAVWPQCTLVARRPEDKFNWPGPCVWRCVSSRQFRQGDHSVFDLGETLLHTISKWHHTRSWPDPMTKKKQKNPKTFSPCWKYLNIIKNDATSLQINQMTCKRWFDRTFFF